MKKIQCYMEKILAKNNKEEMDELSHIFFTMAEHIYDCDHDLYTKIDCMMYKLAYGKKITLELANEWVDSMRPRAKWTKADTDNVIRQKGLQVNDIDFYVVMNMLYSDYHNVLDEELDKYVSMALDFLKDEDAKEDKLFNYYFHIVK